MIVILFVAVNHVPIVLDWHFSDPDACEDQRRRETPLLPPGVTVRCARVVQAPKD